MLFNIGDYVTRKSHNNDMIFKIIEIKDNIVLLSGINVRLVADSLMNDLIKCNTSIREIIKDDEDLLLRVNSDISLERDEYFYLPGKILHIDADNNYLERCIKFYKNMNLQCNGLVVKEKDLSFNLIGALKKYQPDVLVITGHDAFYEKNNDYFDMSNYKNSNFFAEAVKEARLFEKDHQKLVIIAGACQSNYEELIKSGANFASSPKRVNIHALDPAIVASQVCLSSNNTPIDLLSILNKTKYGKDGIGGIITPGVMFVGYPR